MRAGHAQVGSELPDGQAEFRQDVLLEDFAGMPLGYEAGALGLDRSRGRARPAERLGKRGRLWSSVRTRTILGLFLRDGRTSMRAVNIRQLKSNPSVALREAKNDLVVVMNRDTPDAVLVGIEQLGVADLPHVRSALAVSLFRSGDISVGTAAKVAGVPLSDMLGLLSDMGISLYGGGPSDAVQEVETGAEWLATRS